jgi:phosphomannomutase/phosphoglucomutase
LAITAKIQKGNQVLGVVLASLKFDFLNEILAKSPTQDNFIEITQDSISLGSAGNKALKNENPQQMKIADTPWQLSYASAQGRDAADIGSIMGLVITFALLMTVALFLGYYYMASLLKKDQNKVLEAVKNLMTGKGLGAYELQLSEMQVIISTLVQFKRILDNKNNQDESHESHTVHFDEVNAMVEAEEKIDIKKTAANLLKKKK